MGDERKYQICKTQYGEEEKTKEGNKPDLSWEDQIIFYLCSEDESILFSLEGIPYSSPAGPNKFMSFRLKNVNDPSYYVWWREININILASFENLS